MKKLLFAIFLTFLYSVSAYGQVPTNIPNTVIQVFPGAPTGACLSVMVATRQDTGAFYDCFGGAWTPVGGAGAGANSSLSNLSNPTAVNQSIIPGATGLTLGTLANPWANIFIQSLTFPGLEVGFFCFPGTLPTPPTGYGGLGCIDSNGLLDEYNIGASAWQPLVSGGTANQFDVSATTGAGSLDPVLIFPGTASGKFISGVGYSELYAGSDLGARANPCITDAELKQNGNSTGICSSLGEAVVQTVTTPITIGDTNQDAVTWLLPASCNWSILESGSGLPVIAAYSGSSIRALNGSGAHSTPTGYGSCVMELSNGGEKDMYETETTGYYYVDGLTSKDGAHSLTANTVWSIGFAQDASYFGHDSISNSAATNAGLTLGQAGGSPCCTAAFDHLTLNAGYSGGIALVLNGVYDALFYGLSVTHPTAAEPLIKCENGSVVSIYGLYEETYAGQMTSPVNDSTGCSNLAIYGQTVNPLNSGAVTSTPVWQIESGTKTSFTIQGLQASQGSMTTPFVAVNNIPNGVTVPVDALGNLSSYSSNTSYADTFAALLGFIGPSYTANGSTAGFADFSQGTTSTAVPPCNSLNSICEQAPTSVTSYLITKPGAAPTVANSYAATNTAGVQSWASANYQFCGTTTTCSATAEPNAKIVYGSAPLVSGTPSTAAVTGISPAFTSTSSYVCTIAGQSAATTGLYSVANVSSSAFTITGPATTTTVLNYVCVGI